jgi:three-Cys-motif partner protein
MNLPFYEDREQTQVKHQILVKYLSAFVPIVGDWASDIAYIDCFAGPWAAADPDLKDTSFSRALEVLRSTRMVLAGRGKSPTMRCLFIEKDPDAFLKLKEFCSKVSDLEVTPQNWDFTTRISDIVRFAKARSKSFPFIFIDPTGWEPLAIKLITPILRLEPGEVLINLMTSWIRRFLTDETKHFEPLLGSDLPRLRQLQGEEQEEELVRSYAAEVVKAGDFKYACTLPVLKSDQDAFHFYMIYATRHIRGVEVFKQTERSVIPFMHEARAKAQERRRVAQSGQYSLLPPEAKYKERRFTEFQLRNLDIAKNELIKMLRASEQVLFDDAWAKVMQHSAVMENDFRGWLSEWKSSSSLIFVNLDPGQKLPRKDAGQFLKWIER